jgi:GNAT superfamily N-acetyltransferase
MAKRRLDMRGEIEIVTTRPEHFSRIIGLCLDVYPSSKPWNEAQLASHIRVFPEGQLAAIHRPSGLVVGMAASLIVLWDDYEFDHSWREITDAGFFTTHDPESGRTLYGAEIMVDPAWQGMGIGKELYVARRELCRRLGLLRIRAGARLAGFGAYADRLTALEYVRKVIAGEIGDPTLSFQISQGFHVLAITDAYLFKDPESQGFAAVIEWVNEEVARPEDYLGRDPRFDPPTD